MHPNYVKRHNKSSISINTRIGRHHQSMWHPPHNISNQLVRSWIKSLASSPLPFIRAPLIYIVLWILTTFSTTNSPSSDHSIKMLTYERTLVLQRALQLRAQVILLLFLSHYSIMVNIYTTKTSLTLNPISFPKVKPT